MKVLVIIIVCLACIGLYNHGFFTDEKKRQEILDNASTTVNKVINNVQNGGMEVVCIDGYKCLIVEGKTYRLATKGSFGILKSVKCDTN